MRVAEGFVIAEQDVPGVRAPGDTAEVRTTIDASNGCERLEQRVIRFSPGRSLERGGDDRQEVLFVVSGTGTLELDGQEHPLEPGRRRSSLRASRTGSTPEERDGRRVGHGARERARRRQSRGA